MAKVMEVENPMARPIEEPPVMHYGYCQCGCGERITSEYCYVRWEDMYFVDRYCLIVYMKREHGLEEVG